jgi:hypothetical protein
LEEQAAAKDMDTLWKGNKFEVESVLRYVCDSLLLLNNYNANIDIDKIALRRRAFAQWIVGGI